MPTRPRKSSRQVALVLFGAASLVACSEDENLRRDVYASKNDCVADWGDQTKCEQPTVASHSVHGGYWYGPAYHFGQFGSGPGGVADPRPGSHAIATSATSRGGFGASGAAHGAGGG